jgi:hypothetical protein
MSDKPEDGIVFIGNLPAELNKSIWDWIYTKTNQEPDVVSLVCTESVGSASIVLIK